MISNKLAFIGGSGIYKLDILNEVVEHDIVSSFGKPSSKILEGKVNGNSIFFHLTLVVFSFHKNHN